MRLLKELAEERQVLLFTCHSRDKRIAEELGAVRRLEC
jgi:uncharacterized protein YhaN